MLEVGRWNVLFKMVHFLRYLFGRLYTDLGPRLHHSALPLMGVSWDPPLKVSKGLVGMFGMCILYTLWIYNDIQRYIYLNVIHNRCICVAFVDVRPVSLAIFKLRERYIHTYINTTSTFDMFKCRCWHWDGVAHVCPMCLFHKSIGIFLSSFSKDYPGS